MAIKIFESRENLKNKLRNRGLEFDSDKLDNVLKKYNYFEYTDNYLISDERTKEILDEVKKTEKKKALMFVVAAIIQILLYWL